MMANMIRVVIGVGLFLVGVAMLFFEQTRSMGPFPIGFGVGMAAGGAGA